MKRVLLLLAAAALLPGADNMLTDQERREGWELLFDGKSMGGWQDPALKNQPGDAWVIENGCLKTRLKPRIAEDLLTGKSYGDFELRFDWRVAPGGNTGLKYRLQREVFVDETKVQQGPGGFEGLLGREISNPQSDRTRMAPEARAFVYTVGFEMQLIDDERHADALKDARHTTGALYAMIAPQAKAARPAGEWNQSTLRVVGKRVEHWINGTKVLDASLDDPRVKAGIDKRWTIVPAIHEALTHPRPSGPIALQHHGDEVWFRNLRIRTLNTGAR